MNLNVTRPGTSRVEQARAEARIARQVFDSTGAISDEATVALLDHVDCLAAIVGTLSPWDLQRREAKIAVDRSEVFTIASQLDPDHPWLFDGYADDGRIGDRAKWRRQDDEARASRRADRLARQADREDRWRDRYFAVDAASVEPWDHLREITADEAMERLRESKPVHSYKAALGRWVQITATVVDPSPIEAAWLRERTMLLDRFTAEPPEPGRHTSVGP